MRRDIFAGATSARRLATSVLATILLLPGPAAGQVVAVDLDTVRAGRFDYGKMWTFEYPPADYFTQTYDFDADEAWFERARLSVLRIPGCSASFVSPQGLVATNHHCVRGAVARVSGEGESLLDSGFVAGSLAEERKIPGYYADQLMAIEDISDEVFAAVDAAGTAEQRDAARGAVIGAAERRIREAWASRMPEDSIWVQIIPLYDGGRYSAYVFRRFLDVRLVTAAELQLGFFGGDPDNFTYPRYALDFAFLRIYGRDGRPWRPAGWFGWSLDGVEEGDVVFVIGNPGSTNRLKTVAQLEYQRDVQVPATVRWLDSRHAVLAEYRETLPGGPGSQGLRNAMFGLSNSLKANSGRLTALADPVIMARKADAERELREAIMEDPELAPRYGGVFARLAEIQEERRRWAEAYEAFFQLDNGTFASATQRRGRAVLGWLEAREAGQPADSLALLEEEIGRIDDQAPALERALLRERFEELRRTLGDESGIVRAALAGRSPEEAAAALLEGSALATAEGTRRALDGGGPPAGDPALALARTIRPLYRDYRAASNALGNEESGLEATLGRARFEVYGRRVPPDGTFSPRIADGVVLGYEYNGTLAPPYTTFYGLYDRHFGHPGVVDWELPLRWQRPPAGLDLATPLNFVSTADTYGGNSGSPAVTPDLELVGLNFDRNIEGLSRDFIYLPERGRNVMVDVRAIREALAEVYGAERVLQELESAGTPEGE